MGPYAILGSSTLEGEQGFLLRIVRRLVANGYPKAALLQMWEAAWDNLSQLPCRLSLHVHMPTLYSSVRQDIAACF